MKYLTKNLYFNLGILIIGLVSLVVSIFFFDNSTLFGLGVSFTIIGIFNTIQCVKYMKSPEKCEEIEIMNTEERAVFIREKTNSKVYSIFLYIESACCIISGILGFKSATLILAAIMFGKFIAWFFIATDIAKNN